MGLARLTFGVGSVGDAQGGRVGVDAIGDHAVEDPPSSRNLVTCQQPHDPGVTMVELPMGREDKLWHHQHSQAGTLPVRGRRSHLCQTVPGSQAPCPFPDTLGHFLDLPEPAAALTHLD